MNRTAAFFWNMVGSTCYSVSSILFLMVVTRICGALEAGFFSLAYATAQLLLTIGRYGMRTYQATDLSSQYSFREYIVSRAISVFIMLALGTIYSIVSFDGKYIVISILVIGMKAIDAVEDVYHGRLQQVYQVELMGKSQAIRNVYTTICFAGVLLLTSDLLITLNVTVLTSLALCIVMNQYIISRYITYDENEKRLSYKSVAGLMKTCTGLFIGTFLSLLLYNIPKYAMSGVLSAEYQTYYSILFMPSFVVTLLCEFVFKPTITTIADFWFANDKKRFNRTVSVSLAVIVVCSVFVTLAGHFIGRLLLEILYGVDLSSYKLHFIVLLVGGGVSACVYMIYNILIAIRHGGSIKTVYGVVAVVSILIVKPMVVHFSMMGAALNYLVSQFLLLIIFSVILLSVLHKKNISSK